MKTKKRVSLLLLSLLLSSCKGYEEVKLDDYITSIDIFRNQDEVKILQLTDLHWSFQTDFEREKKYLQNLVSICDPDIIMTTGDNILGGNSLTVDTLYKTFDSLTNARGKKVYFGLTWGNHDRQGVYDKDYPDRELLKYTSTNNYQTEQSYEHYGLYRHPSSSLFGRSNYAVNLTDGEKTIWTLYALDTNSDSFNGTKYDYDIIHDDQIAWFNSLNSKIRAEDKDIPSLAFFHIPLYESAFSYDNAYKSTPFIEKGDFGGEVNEPESNIPGLKEYNLKSNAFYVGYQKTDFFKEAKQGGVKGMFYGHDHLNDFWALYDDKTYFDSKTNTVVNPNGTADDVLLAYGVKTGDGLSCDSNKIGGNLITIHKDRSFNGRKSETGTDFKAVYLKY